MIAPGDEFGVKEFSTKEIGAAVRHGAGLDPAPVLPLGRAKRRCLQPQPFISFKLTQSRTIRKFEGTYVFPNQGDRRGGLREAVLVWDPKGVPFSHRMEL